MASLQDAQAPYLTLVEQSAAPTTPNAGDQRIYTKTDGKLYRVDDAGVETEIGAGAGAGAELAYVEYHPNPAATISTASTTMVDAHASLAVTFTAPDSGKVTVILFGSASASINGGAAYWGLRSGTTTVAGTERQSSGTQYQSQVQIPIRIDGLTPGASYTYKWAHRTYSATYASKIVVGVTTDGDIGPASMTVVARA